MSDLPPTGFSWGQILAGGAVALGSLGTAAVAFRNWLVSSNTGIAGDQAQLDVITMLRQQVDSERARADAAVAARDEAMDAMRGMKEEIANLSMQVKTMQTQLATVAKNTSLTGTP